MRHHFVFPLLVHLYQYLKLCNTTNTFRYDGLFMFGYRNILTTPGPKNYSLFFRPGTKGTLKMGVGRT
jgi:hypothetical protein